MSDGQVLVVNARDPEEVRVAMARGSRLEDLRWARTDRTSAVGNLYLGVVRHVEPGLDAAFVDYGAGRAGFLHVGNVHPSYGQAERDPFEVAAAPAEEAASVAGAAREEEGGGEPHRLEIAELLSVGDTVLVQILRDPVRGKGATLTTFVSLAGRLLVLMPSLGRVGVSRRIQDDDERARLRSLVESCEMPEGLGVIARTAAAGFPEADLQRDLDHLARLWERLCARGAAVEAPGLVHAEDSPAVRAVRDLYSPEVEAIVVDEPSLAGELETFLAGYLEAHRPPVRLHALRRPLFESLDIERDYQLLFRARVPVGSGASAVIHETEALTAIDVNSGRVDRGSLEQTAREANKLAAEEIARQIRLRDLGGIIVVDFIDMTQPAHRKEVERTFREALRGDRARLKIGRLASFGLMPLTRRRQGTGLPRMADLPCRTCSGLGSVADHQAGALRALRRLRAADEGAEGAAHSLRVHPGVAGVLETTLSGAVEELGLDVEIVSDSQLAAADLVLERR